MYNKYITIFIESVFLQTEQYVLTPTGNFTQYPFIVDRYKC